MYIHNNYEKNKFSNNKLFKKFIYLIRDNNLKKIVYLFLFIVILTPLFTACTTENVSNKGKWIVVEDEMSKKRNFATSNLLPDGNVLIMGGEDKSTDTADIFDPKKMKIVKTVQCNDRRFFGYSATSLINGDVYISGGYLYPTKGMPILTNTTKIFDANTYTFKTTKNMKFFPGKPKSFLLKNNNVLILNNIINPGALGRENMRFEIYNPEKNEYYQTKNMIHKTTVGDAYMFLDNGNILFSCYGNYPNNKNKTFNSNCLYNFDKNTFEPYSTIPKDLLFIQLDYKNYLTIKPEATSSSGYVYNIETKEKIPVKNRIKRTWRPGIYPQMILLENGDVLILGIPLKNNSDKYETSGNNIKTSRYSAYIYSRKDNAFFEIQAPPIPVYNAGIVKLKNGDILLAGGKVNNRTISNKIQVFRYKK